MHRDPILDRLATRGERLREIACTSQRGEPGVSQRWFQGPSGCDLFLWSDQGGLLQLQLTVGERAVEWTRGGSVRTARLTSFDLQRPGSDRGRLVADRGADPTTLDQARALLSRAPIDDITLALVRRILGAE